MPAAPIAARRHLLAIIHESVTSQYRQGVKHSSSTPISWHSPPNRLQASPCPNSCRILTTASVAASANQFVGPKNSVLPGSRSVNSVHCEATKSSADSPTPMHKTSAGQEKSQPA